MKVEDRENSDQMLRYLLAHQILIPKELCLFCPQLTASSFTCHRMGTQSMCERSRGTESRWPFGGQSQTNYSSRTNSELKKELRKKLGQWAALVEQPFLV